MPIALACASHTPSMFDLELADQATCDAVAASFATMRSFVEEFDPEIIIQFSPDHFHGFLYDLMPSFCIGLEATSCGDWGTKEGQVPVDRELAADLLAQIRASDIDIAFSHNMMIDHGFVQMWELLFGRFDRYPLIPIFVNCIAWPMPTYRRVRLLGEAVGRFASTTGRRVLLAASGGLSHDPQVPRLETASPETYDRLTRRTVLTKEQQREREAMLREAGRSAKHGQGNVRPLNPEWDHRFLDLLSSADWPAIDGFTAEAVDRDAGSAGNEVLAWLAAMAGLAAAGPFEIVQRDYRAVPGWVAGVGHLTARGL